MKNSSPRLLVSVCALLGIATTQIQGEQPETDLSSVVTDTDSVASIPSTPTHNLPAIPSPPVKRQFIYAAHPDGTITVHDINRSHSLVKIINVFSTPGADPRGAAAAVATSRFYLFYNVNQEGHVACIDLRNDTLVWDRVVHIPGVDRGDVTVDGQRLYVPSGEGDLNSPYELVLDAATGNLLSTIAMPPETHDTLCSLDGTKIFMENKDSSDYRVRVVSTVTDQVLLATDQFNNKVQPFSVTADNRFLIADVVGTYGFQYADLSTGRILGTALFTGTTYQGANGILPHGIGMTPDEREAWVCDKGMGSHFVHVFDITSLPPQQTRLVTVSNDNPHWLTFTIDGRYCYVAGAKNAEKNTDIISTATSQRVGVIPPSEDLLEIDFNSDGVVTAVGSQFGVGRASAPALTRIAVSCDGNQHDRSDICSTPMALAILSKAGRAPNLVYYGYNDHYWQSIQSWESDMRDSVNGTISRWPGFNPSVFYDVRADKDAAVTALKNAINASSAPNPLTILEAGPAQVIGEAMAASDPSARQFVTVVSHSPWNDTHAADSGPSEGLTGPIYSFSDLATMGATVNQIHDQNGNTNGPYSNFYWLRDSSDPKLTWLWNRGQVAAKIDFDDSDSGMVYYLVARDANGTPTKYQVFLTSQGFSVGMTDPAPGAVFTEHAAISLSALAIANPGAMVMRIEFYRDATTLLGSSTPNLPSSSLFNGAISWNDVPVGTFTLTAKAFDDSGATKVSTPITISVTPAAPTADLKVTVSDGKSMIAAGQTTTYTIKVTNVGPASVTGATVTDNFPAIFTGVTYTATQTGGASGFSASGTGNINHMLTMPAGSVVTYKATGKVSSAATGTLSNSATVAAPSGVTDSNLSDNSATDSEPITLKAELKVTVNDGKTATVAGAKNTYTIVVTNIGPSNVSGVVINDSFPNTFIGVTYTATQSGGASGYTTAGSGNIHHTVAMPTGSKITYKATGTISASATGSISNTATASAPSGVTDPNLANNSATDTDSL